MHIIIYIIVIIISLVIGYFTSTGVKSQWIRLIDIFVYGPFLIWVSTQIIPIWAKIALIFMGATTMSYNLRNYIKISRKK